MTQTPDEPTPGYVPTIWTLALGVLVLALGVGAYLALVLTGHEEQTGDLLGFLAPAAGALVIVGYQQRQHKATAARLTEQDQQLRTITRQTNGVLDQRIRENTAQAFREDPTVAESIRENTRIALADMLQAHLKD